MMLTIANTQEFVKEVVDQVKRAVVATMGPNGKLAFIANGTAVKVTKDGVTVAKSIRFDDPRHELINRVITEAAIKTDHECGDGTTTTVMLTSLLYNVFIAHPTFREQKYIESCMNAVIEELKAMTVNVTVDDPRLFKLALTSSNNDEELSKIITDIYKASGDRYPEIELKEGQTAEDKVVHTNGLPIQMGFSNPGFAKNGNGGDTDFTDFTPLIIDGNVGRGADLSETLINLSMCLGGRTVLVIGRSVEHDTCQIMARLNAATAAQRAKERVTGKPEGVPAAFFVAINTNAGGSVGTLLMQDIATMFGAPIYTNLEDVLNSHGAPIVQSTLTVNGTRSILSNIPDETRALLNARADAVAQELSSYEMGDRFSVRAKFNETRIRNLRGELITIFVGGETYSDVKERIDRFEDVVKAVKSALVNGVLPGVGSSLVTAGKRVLTRLYRELPDPFKDGTDTPHEREIAIKVMIISALAEVCYASHNHLMRQTSDEVSPFKELRWNSIEGDVVPPCTNLATGETGTSEELGVYDTAYATITALKGGLQTAKILANASSILLGDKLSAVPMKR
jgi:chaperonin GroEL